MFKVDSVNSISQLWIILETLYSVGAVHIFKHNLFISALEHATALILRKYVFFSKNLF